MTIINNAMVWNKQLLIIYFKILTPINIYIYIYSIMEVWHNGGPCYERVKKMYLQLLTSSQQLKSPVDQGTGDSGWDFKSGLAAGLGGGFDWFVIWTGTPVAVQW